MISTGCIYWTNGIVHMYNVTLRPFSISYTHKTDTLNIYLHILFSLYPEHSFKISVCLIRQY